MVDKGVNFTKVVADEDTTTSSHLRTIHNNITKISGRNHIRKTFSSNLYGLQPKHKSLSTKVNRRLGLSQGKHTKKFCYLRDSQSRKRQAIARTKKAKRRRIELKAKKCQTTSCKEIREGPTYMSGVGIGDPYSAVKEIPRPSSVPQHQSLSSIKDHSHVFFDLETTGLARTSHILQVGAVCGDETFSTYVMPKEQITPSASEVTGLKLHNGALYHNERKYALSAYCYQKVVKRNIPSLQCLVVKNVLSAGMAKKVAGSGLDFECLRLAHSRSADVIHALFTEQCGNSSVRVTKCGTNGNLSVKCGSPTEAIVTTTTTVSSTLIITPPIESTSVAANDKNTDATRSSNTVNSSFDSLLVESTQDDLEIIYIIAGFGSGGAIILVGLVVLILIVMKMKRSMSAENKERSSEGDKTH
uniref:PML C-terminal domain-containing protein n=1 Tax=Magallana gigas TaxID=29159 RepID=A0A8W8JD45_MAGGI